MNGGYMLSCVPRPQITAIHNATWTIICIRPPRVYLYVLERRRALLITYHHRLYWIVCVCVYCVMRWRVQSCRSTCPGC